MMDAAEVVLDQFERYDAPTDHFFWNGFYIRQIHMPKGFVCTTKIHKKRHPFSITKGKVEVCDNEGEYKLMEAPYVGITEPGTRRISRVIEDCTWTTFHATEAESVEAAEVDLILPHESPHSIPYANARNEHQYVLHND